MILTSSFLSIGFKLETYVSAQEAWGLWGDLAAPPNILAPPARRLRPRNNLAKEGLEVSIFHHVKDVNASASHIGVTLSNHSFSFRAEVWDHLRHLAPGITWIQCHGVQVSRGMSMST